jgi:hypothetical protein
MTARCRWEKEGSKWLTAKMRAGAERPTALFCYINTNARNRKNKLELTCFVHDDGILRDSFAKSAPLNQENVRAFRELGCAFVHDQIKKK